MANYKPIEYPIRYEFVGDEIAKHINENPHTEEVRFSKLKHPRKYMYGAFILEPHSSPSKLTEVDFHGSFGVEGIQRMIQHILVTADKDNLPQEIRVIRPHLDTKCWGLFY